MLKALLKSNQSSSFKQIGCCLNTIWAFVQLCRSLFILLAIVLSFFVLWILITSLISSNFF